MYYIIIYRRDEKEIKKTNLKKYRNLIITLLISLKRSHQNKFNFQTLQWIYQ